MFPEGIHEKLINGYMTLLEHVVHLNKCAVSKTFVSWYLNHGFLNGRWVKFFFFLEIFLLLIGIWYVAVNFNLIYAVPNFLNGLKE